MRLLLWLLGLDRYVLPDDEYVTALAELLVIWAAVDAC